MASSSTFTGAVQDLDRAVSPISGRVWGASRLAVADQRIFVVLTPESTESPLLWISVDLSEVRIRQARGFLWHRRERAVTLATDRWALRMRDPHRVLHSQGITWPTGRTLQSVGHI